MTICRVPVLVKNCYGHKLTREKGTEGDKIMCNTSKGVKGQLPFNLIDPGIITRPGLVNFPLQPLSLAASMSIFSCSPPSYMQQEKATISCRAAEEHIRCFILKEFVYIEIHPDQPPQIEDARIHICHHYLHCALSFFLPKSHQELT